MQANIVMVAVWLIIQTRHQSDFLIFRVKAKWEMTNSISTSSKIQCLHLTITQ